jgi:hypothetical protein
MAGRDDIVSVWSGSVDGIRLYATSVRRGKGKAIPLIITRDASAKLV